MLQHVAAFMRNRLVWTQSLARISVETATQAVSEGRGDAVRAVKAIVEQPLQVLNFKRQSLFCGVQRLEIVANVIRQKLPLFRASAGCGASEAGK